MVTRRARRPQPSAEDLLLDGFFEAWSRADTREIANAVSSGHVTGMDLARKLNWSCDKVSRRTDELRSGGIVAKRRVHGWMKTTLTTVGVEAAQRWARLLEEAPIAVLPTAWIDHERMCASSALASEKRRRLLRQLVVTPGATQAELVTSCGLSQPTASRELRVLIAAGFIEMRHDGARARHHLSAEAVGLLHEWLDDYAVKLADRARATEAIVLARAGQTLAAAAEAPSPVPPPGEGATPDIPAAVHVQPDLNDNEPRGGPRDLSEPDDPATRDSDAA